MIFKQIVVECACCEVRSDRSPEVFVSFDGEKGICQPCVALCVETFARRERDLVEAAR